MFGVAAGVGALYVALTRTTDRLGQQPVPAINIVQPLLEQHVERLAQARLLLPRELRLELERLLGPLVP